MPGFGAALTEVALAEVPSAAITSSSTAPAADTSDPLYYDWWRNQARRKIKEKVEEAAAEQEFEQSQPDPPQPIREEAIEAMVSANSLAELYDIDLLLHEQAILNQLIREYQRYVEQDEDEAEFLLVLH